MKKHITFIILIISFSAFGQSFQYVENNPFNINSADPNDPQGRALKYIFFDHDNDGDKDLITFGLGESDTTSGNPLLNLNYFISYQENVGTSTEPSFIPMQSAYDNFHFPTGFGFLLPSASDLNSDGLLDFVISAETDIYNIQYLQFQMQTSNEMFEMSNCLDWDLESFSPYSLFVPEITDLDSDGDPDILLSGYYARFNEEIEIEQHPVCLYAKNIGTASDPEFLGWFNNPYGLVTPEQSMITSGDLDKDGDMDLMVLDLGGDQPVLNYWENTGTTKPEFTSPVESPFGLPVAAEDESFLFPTFVDLDEDGDLDLFLPVNSEDQFELRYYENTDCSPQSAYLELDGMELKTFGVPGNTYTWVKCDNNEVQVSGEEPTYTPVSSGSYKVVITDQSGCMSVSDCIEVILSNVLENGTQYKVQVYPIPSQGVVKLESNDLGMLDHVTLHSSKGEVFNIDYLKGENSIDLSSFPSGIYFLNLKFGEREVIKKVVIVK